MTECTTCGDEGSPFLYTCNFCSASVCPDHRLPENHECLPAPELEAARKNPETEPVREPPRASHETCAECNNAVASGKELCQDCRYDPARTSSGTEETASTSGGGSGGNAFGLGLENLRYRAETSWIRTQSWGIMLVLGVVVFGGLLSGLYLMLAHNSGYFGVTVPEVVLGGIIFQPPLVAALGGLFVMLASFGIGLKVT